MSNTEILFFDLIKVATKNHNRLSGIPTSNEWIEIYQLAKQQTLVGILFAAIEKLPSEQRPPKTLLMQWFAYAENIRNKNIQVNADAVKICDEIRKDGMQCMVLKGQGVATYYPEPLLRQCGDIDLWLEGGLHKVKSYIQAKGEIKGIIYTHIEYDAPIKTEVEIHHCPSYFYNPLYLYRMKKYFAEQSFNETVELGENVGSISVPTLEFNRYYILLHIYRHYFTEGIGLRQMLDYYYVLLKGGAEESKQRTMRMFAKTGMIGFVGATMWVLQKVYGLEEKYMLCNPDEKRGKQLLNEILIAGNFGKYDSRINRNSQNGLLLRAWISFKRKMKFFSYYPKEILFDIPMRIYMYIWRHIHK